MAIVVLSGLIRLLDREMTKSVRSSLTRDVAAARLGPVVDSYLRMGTREIREIRSTQRFAV